MSFSTAGTLDLRSQDLPLSRTPGPRTQVLLPLRPLRLRPQSPSTIDSQIGDPGPPSPQTLEVENPRTPSSPDL